MAPSELLESPDFFEGDDYTVFNVAAELSNVDFSALVEPHFFFHPQNSNR